MRAVAIVVIMQQPELISLQFHKGYIIGLYHNKVATINSIFVKPEFRNKGWAMCLIKEFVKRAQELGAVRVEVDDCTDRFRVEHNLYVKCGFKYRDSYGPEMHANVRNVLKNIEI